MTIKNNSINIKIILKTYLLVLSIFTIFRAILFLSNYSYFGDLPTQTLENIGLAFLMGLRFDIVVSSYILILPHLILSIIFLFKNPSRFLIKLVFYIILIVFSFAIFVSAVDIPFFNQFFSRLSMTAFMWVESPVFVVKMILGESSYWLYIFPLLFLLYIFFKGLKRIFWQESFVEEGRNHFVIKLIINILFLFLMLLGIRGRLEIKSPIRVGTAYFCTDPFLNQLGLNPNFTLLRSFLNSRKNNNTIKMMADDEAISNIQTYLKIDNSNEKYPLARQISPKDTNKIKANIVLVLMESMSAAKMSRYGNENHLTPFLDSLAGVSYCFDNFYSAGIHTHNGLYSSICSYPAQMGKHSLKGVAMLKYNGLAVELAKNGYKSIYFTSHDGQFDNTEGFLRANGFDEIISEKDYPREKIVSNMGVPDDYLFEYSIPVLNKLSRENEAFFATILTSSDHSPYLVPEYFSPKSDGIKNQVVEYADWSLRKFIEMAKKQDWFSNTIFVFVADHGAPINPIYDMPLNYHHIPFIIFSPNLLDSGKVISGLGSQIDIMPTLMNLLNLGWINNGFGIDLLNDSREFVSFSADDKYGVISEDYFLIVQSNGREGLYKYRDKNLTNYINQMPKLAKQMKKYAQSHIQSAQYLTLNKLQFVH